MLRAFSFVRGSRFHSVPPVMSIRRDPHRAALGRTNRSSIWKGARPVALGPASPCSIEARGTDPSGSCRRPWGSSRPPRPRCACVCWLDGGGGGGEVGELGHKRARFCPLGSSTKQNPHLNASALLFRMLFRLFTSPLFSRLTPGCPPPGPLGSDNLIHHTPSSSPNDSTPPVIRCFVAV